MRGLARRTRWHAGYRRVLYTVACGLLATACSYSPQYDQSLCARQAPQCPGGFTCDATSNRCVKGNDASVAGPGGSTGTTGTGGGPGDIGQSGGHGASASGGAPASGGTAGNGGAGDSTAAGGAGASMGAGGAASGGAIGNGGAGGSCPAVCTLGKHSCAANLLRTCVLSDGCPAWDAGQACGTHAACTQPEGADASCVCATAPAGCQGAVGSYCDGDGTTLQTCLSDNGCLYLQSPATTCPSAKPCTGTGGRASCSCPPEPSACMGVAGTTCSGAAQIVTCSRDANQCLVVSGQPSSCNGAAQCAGQPGTALCSCPASLTQCQGVVSGSVCSGNDIYSCALDGGGCATATKTASCTAGKPCNGGTAGINAACTCANPASDTDCPAGQTAGAHCAGNMLVSCTTNSDGCVSASKATCSGSCGHSYPAATCLSEQSFGWPADAGGSESSTTGFLAGVPVTVTTAATLQRFGIISHAAGASVVMALYSSDASGNPAARLAYIGSATLATGVNEFAATPAGVTLAANTTYWIMVATSATVTVGGGPASQAQLDYVSYTFGSPIPATWPAMGSFSTAPVNPPPTYYIVALPQ